MDLGHQLPLPSPGQLWQLWNWKKMSQKRNEGGFHTPLHACSCGSSSDAPRQPHGGQIRERIPFIIILVKEKSYTEVRRNPSLVSFGLIKNSSPYTAMRVKWG